MILNRCTSFVRKIFILTRCVSDKIGFLGNTERKKIKKELIKKYHGIIRAKGAQIIIEPYITPKKIGSIIMSETARTEDMFHSVISRIVDIGPLAYTNKDYCGGLSWGDIGDWVVVPRTAGQRLPLASLETECLRIVLDTDVVAVVKDPTDFQIKISTTKY